MRTKSILYGLAVLSFSTATLFTACKKKETKDPVVTQTPDGQSGTDSREAQGENDAAINEINDVISNSPRLAGKGAAASGVQGVTGDICGLAVDSVDILNKVIKFNYSGVTCFNRTRTGSIKLTLQGNKWRDAGAVIKVEYINYKIVRASDQKSMLFNGIQYLTNVSGGTWWELIITKSKSSLVSTVTGSDLKVTFEDGKIASYNINRKITYTYPNVTGTTNYILTVTAEGIGYSGGLSSLENYGTARNGDGFTSQVTTPIVWNVTCGGAVLQGAVTVTDNTQNINLKFYYGVDASGNAQAVGANACPFGWKLEWNTNGTTHSKVFGYN